MKGRIRDSMYEEWINKEVLKLLDQVRYPKKKMVNDNDISNNHTNDENNSK